MSRPNDNQTGDGKVSRGDYEVGYGKPPVATRFKKGQSGNPKGRPKGARNSVPTAQGLDFGTQPANQMLLREAYRTVTLREGDKTVELPVIQAVFRSLGVSAMKGNRLAQATMAEFVRGIEEEDRRSRSSLFKTACEYKIGWEQAIDTARARGLPEPEPVPHPDDVILDFRRAVVSYAGPVTREEKARWDQSLERRQRAQEEVSLSAQHHRRARSPRTKSMWLDMWHHEQKMFDVINDNLPERYRVKLKDRSWKEGASRAGDQKRVSWPGEG